MDPFRETPGNDVPFALGTVLRCSRVHDLLSQPMGLRNTVLNPAEQGEVFGDKPVGGGWRPGQGRTSYVLLQHPILSQLPAHVVQASFVTALAGVTRHLPVAVTFLMGEHEDHHHHHHHAHFSYRGSATPRGDRAASAGPGIGAHGAHGGAHGGAGNGSVTGGGVGGSSFGIGGGGSINGLQFASVATGGSGSGSGGGGFGTPVDSGSLRDLTSLRAASAE